MTDHEARRQLLLTRMALERAEWLLALDAVRRASRPGVLAQAAWRQAGQAGLAKLAGVFGLVGGRGGLATPGLDGLRPALALVRRFRLAASVLGLALPRWRRLRRGVVVLGLAAAAWTAWRNTRPAPPGSAAGRGER